MLNKIYDKILKYIKENYKSLLFMFFFILLITIPTNYEVYTPGGLINLNNRIEVEAGTESEGSFNLTYVGAKKGTLPILLLSLVIPNWDIESLDESRIENEDYNEIIEREKISLLEGNKYSIVVAFEAANVDYEIINNDLVVYYVEEAADTSLKIGDIILSINDITVETTEDIANIMKNYDNGEKINIRIERDKKEKEVYAYVREEEGKKFIGIYIISMLDIKTSREVEFKNKNNETGSSGGLMNALTIYDMLVDEDITKGNKISGTGTIDINGIVGEVAGIKYKLAGAVKKKADIFIVPEENYEEAIEEKEKNNYDIDIIKADTFENVVNILKNK